MTKRVRLVLSKQDRTIEERLAIAVLDSKGRFVVMNEGALEILGYSRQELIGRSCSFLLTPKDRRRMKGHCKSALQKGTGPFRVELELPAGPHGRRMVALELLSIRHGPTYLGTLAAAKPMGQGTVGPMIETAGELILAIDVEGRILFASAAAAELLGYRPRELVGKRIILLMPEHSRRARETSWFAIMGQRKGALPSSRSFPLLHKNGREITAEIAVGTVNVDGSAIAIAIIRNGTKPGRVEDELPLSLVENLPDIISRLDRKLRFLYVSPNVKAVFGIPAAQFLGKRPREIDVRSHDWGGFEKACREVFATGKATEREFTRAGRYYRARIVPESGPAGKPDSILCVDQDITEQKRTEAELRTLSSRLLDLQDAERRRIAREMHDGTAQNLFAINIALTRLLQQTTAPEFRATLEECMSLCEQSREEIRTLSYVLHPPMLEQAGLASALKWYLEGFSSRTRIDVDLFVSRKLRRLPAEIETDLFRIAQEALTNIHLHSGSSIATVKLVRGPGYVMLQIRDSGSGIPQGIAQKGRAGGIGVGIPGMRERLAQLNGTLDVDSSGAGTTITAIVPLTKTRTHVLTSADSGQKQA